MLTLVSIPYSPWSEKARWALDYQKVSYRKEGYLPMLGIPKLRVRTGRYRGKLTIPVLLGDGKPLFDSMQIAARADELGEETPLFSAELQREILSWNEKSEKALEAVRALVAARVLADDQAREEALPKMPRGMRTLMRPLANLGVSYLEKKYGFRELEDAQATYCGVLSELRDALDDSEYLLGNRFTYADLCMAVALQGVRPVGDDYIRLGKATRKAWTDEDLATEFADLLRWRDAMYAQHRQHEN